MPKSSSLTSRSRIHEDIRGLEVTVEYEVLVCVTDRLAHRNEEAQTLCH